MAWNEPGGNSNDQDPWGGRRDKDERDRDRQESPDLDDAIRKLKASVGGILGDNTKKRPRSGGSGDNSPERNGGVSSLVGVLFVALASFWLYNATYVVDEQEQAVILRAGKYYETVGPGLNLYVPPLDRKYQENVTRERAYSKQGQMLTQDENIVEVPLTVQYRISNLQDFVLNVDQPEISLQHATDSALRHVVGSTSMDKVLTEGREQMAAEVKDRLQQFLDTYKTGITVTQVNIQSAAAPREVQEAFDDVIRAREDEQREKNQAEAYANSVIPEARGQAQRILEDANGYREEVVARAQGEASRFKQLLTEYQKAPLVTRERLYLETMQEVLSNSSKVLTGGDGKNNVLYLPLDRMGGAAPSAVSPAAPMPAAPMATTPAAPVTESLRQPAEQARATRTRESR